MPNRPLVSVIVPVLNDTAALARLAATLTADQYVEIIVVDGGFDPAIGPLLASRADVRLVRTSPGRAHQMNAGAAHATGAWLLFLHADSALPRGWVDAIQFAHDDPDVTGGWFRFRLDATAWQARLIERMVRARVHLFRLPYGDQGLFVRKTTFDALGGYRPLPLMEDIEFVRRLARTGRMYQSPLPLTTSARRWERDGWFRRSGRNLALVSAYFAGVPPERLAKWY